MIAATQQAQPVDVFAPILSALSSSSVVITWQIPGQPNGVITEYQVFIEGQEVATKGLHVNRGAKV